MREMTAREVSTAWFSLAMSAGTLICLACLHILSPEFDPAWRVVSEYAMGGYAWMLSLMFLTWALGSWALAFAIHSQVRTVGGRIGLGLLALAGTGEALAAAFDISWPILHGVAGLLGVPPLPVAAVLISINLGRLPTWASARRGLLWTAHLTWMSLLLLLAAIATLTTSIGGMRVPIGWPNRFLVATYVIWAMNIAWQAIRLRGKGLRPAGPRPSAGV